MSKRENFKRPDSALKPVLSQCDFTVITETLISLPHDLDKLLISTVQEI